MLQAHKGGSGAGYEVFCKSGTKISGRKLAAESIVDVVAVKCSCLEVSAQCIYGRLAYLPSPSPMLECSRGHKLQVHTTKVKDYICDCCEQRFPPGSVLYGCRKCDWDACEKCQQGKTDVVFKQGYEVIVNKDFSTRSRHYKPRAYRWDDGYRRFEDAEREAQRFESVSLEKGAVGRIVSIDTAHSAEQLIVMGRSLGPRSTEDTAQVRRTTLKVEFESVREIHETDFGYLDIKTRTSDTPDEWIPMYSADMNTEDIFARRWNRGAEMFQVEWDYHRYRQRRMTRSVQCLVHMAHMSSGSNVFQLTEHESHKVSPDTSVISQEFGNFAF